jgi:hypothetical protein
VPRCLFLAWDANAPWDYSPTKCTVASTVSMAKRGSELYTRMLAPVIGVRINHSVIWVGKCEGWCVVGDI